jgi:hypothetical protein
VDGILVSAGWVYGTPSPIGTVLNCYHDALAEIAGPSMVLVGSSVNETDYLNAAWIREMLGWSEDDWTLADGNLPEPIFDVFH